MNQRALPEQQRHLRTLERLIMLFRALLKLLVNIINRV